MPAPYDVPCRSTRSRRRAALLAAPLLLLPMVACSDNDRDDPDGIDTGGGGREGVPTSMADLRWNVDDSLADTDVCGTWVVRSSVGEEPLHVLDVATERVLVPQVTAPPGSELAPAQDWLTSGGCVPTEDGPVVVVETQERYADLDAAPPKLVAGFTPTGEQLWVREADGRVFGDYTGQGAFLLEALTKGEDLDAWTLVDARSGETVAEGADRPADVEAQQPMTVLGRDLVSTIEGEVLRLPGHRVELTGAPGLVDAERVLLRTVEAMELVRLRDGEVLWRRPDAQPVVVGVQVADLSTGIVLASAGGSFVGLDLATGETRWTSPVAPEEVNDVQPQVGAGVVVLQRPDDLDEQVVLSARTGEVLDTDEHLVAGADVLLAVDEDGRPRSIAADDLD
ncbi:PQQ-binding-like beta-propeller repeat protein [Nocardioides sp. zg-536]|uniref:PQQ-binding-like beta-propeller repeat protein n=1 Tax=Nocardioides faecalis TaxID=2803858 RepID=A0A938Y6X8_9ACTN|nr:PQQ-binding-like beta-propeller repeat protein [Nocardioides faecalis]MBM9460319.1 PQQ-binding-like beta-propeller repeat protein [Nocardioides faecalis]QVI59849.1 PQQ-binding-like beta-propeller repeat protein [Nocardioides faecalis]